MSLPPAEAVAVLFAGLPAADAVRWSDERGNLPATEVVKGDDMPNRRRLAAVAAPLLGLLAALLLGWSVAVAQAPEPFSLTVTAGRSECTAGTLNPVTWEISGGTLPYTLTLPPYTVFDASDNAYAAGIPVPCGDLPEGASTAPTTFMAVVTDARGATATASTVYTIVPPLPAPTGLRLDAAVRYGVWLVWDAVDGAGSQSPFDQYLFQYLFPLPRGGRRGHGSVRVDRAVAVPGGRGAAGSTRLPGHGGGDPASDRTGDAVGVELERARPVGPRAGGAEHRRAGDARHGDRVLGRATLRADRARVALGA